MTNSVFSRNSELISQEMVVSHCWVLDDGNDTFINHVQAIANVDLECAVC